MALDDNLEFCIKLDDDDKKSLAMISRLQAIGCKVVFGPRYSGYNSLGRFITELASIAECQWFWPFDDDAYVEGSAFTEQLADIPTSGVYVLPSLYCLGASNYAEFHQYPIVPRGCWAPHSEIQHPPDTFLYEHLVGVQGWKPKHLKNINVRHDWHGHEDHEIK